MRHQAVFNYELKLVVSADHPLAGQTSVTPEALSQEHLITFPVAHERLDVYTQFLIPEARAPRHQQEVEAMEIMVQLVAANRGVCTLPDWLAERYRAQYDLKVLSLGETGVAKTLYLIYRAADAGIDYLADFVAPPADQSVIA